MSRIYWDSMLFIYWLEKQAQFLPVVERVLTRMEARNDTLCTSAFTLGEVLVGPKSRGTNRQSAKSRSSSSFRKSKFSHLPSALRTSTRVWRLRGIVIPDMHADLL